MTDLDRVHEMEEIFGVKLKQVTEEDFGKKDFFTVNPFNYSLRNVINAFSPLRGARNFCLNENGRLTGLSLDCLPVFLLSSGFLQQFNNLCKLSVRSAGFTEMSFLTGSKRLTSLDLSGNQLTELSFLKEFKWLTELDLRNNQVNEVSFLKDLKKLTYLDLRNNQLTNVSFLRELKLLSSLGLSYNKLTEVSFLKDLKELTELDLSSNQLTDISFLNDLKGLTLLGLRDNLFTEVFNLTELNGLTELDLSGNRFADLSFLKDLKRLTSLFLNDIQLTQVSILRELKGLTSLEIRNNLLTDVSFLKELNGLTSLDLGENQLTDVSFLKEFKGLKSLDVGGNQLSEMSFLKELKALTSIDLSDNQLTEVSFLKELKGLISLSLSNNKLFEVSFLNELQSLTSLGVSCNNLTDVSFLKDLKALTSLDASGNQLTDLSILKDFKELSSLDLKNNQLTNLSYLKDLKGLTSLDLSSNKLVEVSFLKELKGLTSLDLSSNKLVEVSFLKDLKGLTSLDLSYNKLTDVTYLKELSGLISLDVSHNKLTEVSFLKELKRLAWLDLTKNKIKALPECITELNLEIDIELGFWDYGYITLKDNPIEIPPLETVQQGRDAVRNYFEQLAVQGYDYVYEAKMLVLGEGGSGKTSLVRKLKDESATMPEDKDTTRGIEITELFFTVPDKENPTLTHRLKLNVWDFGGQQIYHATHRFFLTNRAVYTLVADTREGGTDFNYWFQVIEKFGGESPVLPVINEKFKRTQPIENFHHLRDRYKNVREKMHSDIGSMQNLSNIKDAVRDLSLTLPDIGSKVPKKWTEIRATLGGDNRPYIEHSEFTALCTDHGLSTNDSKYLSGFFHCLGAFLHFADNDLLRNKVFLKPQWVTNAVFKIIDSPLVKEQKGEFSRGDALKIWDTPEYKDVLPELLELMKCFLLIYQVNGSDAYIMPQYLPQDQPKYEPFKTNCKTLRYRYDEFMPRGILHQLITQMHEKIAATDLVWFSGVILKHRGTEAEILESYSEKKLTIKVKGSFPRDLIMLITEQLDKINGTYSKLSVDKYLQCNCIKCASIIEPHEYPFETLMRFLKDNREIQCPKSYEMVPPRIMLEDVFYDAYLSKSKMKYGDRTERDMRNEEKVPQKPAVYFSYAWDDEESIKKGVSREELIDQLYTSLSAEDIKVKRDKMDLGYKGLISEFMKEIGMGKIVVVGLTDKYLRSPFCMNELLSIYRTSLGKPEILKDRIFPVWIEKLPLGNLAFKDQLYDEWEQKFKEFNTHYEKHREKFSAEELEEFKMTKDINAEISALISMLRNMNALTKELLSDNNFKIIKDAIKELL